MPVSDPERWRDATRALTEAVSFLSGDRWEFRFTQRARPVVFPRRGVRRRHRGALVAIQPTDSACLFSGGLDSLAGAIDYLAGGASRLLLIGHHHGDMAGPFADQRALIEPLRSAYPQRFRPTVLRIGQSPSVAEITLRSRSLLFIALGMDAVTSAATVFAADKSTGRGGSSCYGHTMKMEPSEAFDSLEGLLKATDEMDLVLCGRLIPEQCPNALLTPPTAGSVMRMPVVHPPTKTNSSRRGARSLTRIRTARARPTPAVAADGARWHPERVAADGGRYASINESD
jgi:hypothetical protein